MNILIKNCILIIFRKKLYLLRENNDKIYYQLDIPQILLHPITNKIWKYIPSQYNNPNKLIEIQKAIDYVNKQIKVFKK